MRQTKIVVTRYGGPEVITVAEQECPAPMPGEVRVKVLAAGVSLPDVLAREGVHPETPRVPYTPGWDLVGIVDQIGEGVSGFELGQTVAAMPISGCYAQYVCLPQRKFIPVPAGLDPAEAVAVVLNYITAYQMLHRSAKVKPGQRVLIHGASGGVGTAFLQLGRLAGVEMYGTCSAQAAEVVKELGATPIDYRNSDSRTGSVGRRVCFHLLDPPQGPYERHPSLSKAGSARPRQICGPRPVVRLPAYRLPLALFFGCSRSPCISEQPARCVCALDRAQ